MLVARIALLLKAIVAAVLARPFLPSSFSYAFSLSFLL
jgi:hypothetical protein